MVIGLNSLYVRNVGSEIVLTLPNFTKDQQSIVPAKVCPRCGNLDYNDDFVVIRCSKCHDAYFAHEARDSEIVI